MSDITTVRENNGSTSTSAKTSGRRVVAPPVDVFENDDELLIVADVPGAAGDAIDLRVENGTLRLEARRPDNKEAWPALAREYDEVDYVTTFRLPGGIETTAIGAETKNGTLFVRLPKAAAAKPRKIAVH